MALDRTLQLKILSGLAEFYPVATTQLEARFRMDTPALAFIANVAYLREHGLISGGFNEVPVYGGSSLEGRFTPVATRITAAGMDFLADDGGLSAMLKTITIRLDPTQLTQLLANKIEQLPDISHEDRSTIADALRKLPAKSAEKVLEKMLDWAADHAGDALPLLRTVLSQLAG